MSQSQLQPGDPLLRGSPSRHVGTGVGGGDGATREPHTSGFVTGPPGSRGDGVGAVRP